MGKNRLKLVLFAAAVLLAVTLSAASPLPAATLTCPDTLGPGVVATATLHITGEAISGVSFTLDESDNLTLNACYILSPGWTMAGSGGRYAAHSASAPVTALDVQFSFTVDAVTPGEALSLAVDELTLTDGRSDTALPSLRWQSVFRPSRGDLNGDKAGDIQDLQCLYDYLSQGVLPGGYAGDEASFRAAADVDGSGTVDILDYQALYRLLLA